MGLWRSWIGCFRSGGVVRAATEANCGKNCENRKDHENGELGELEWRLCLRGSERVGGWRLPVELHDQDEDVEIEGERARDHVRLSPAPARWKP